CSAGHAALEVGEKRHWRLPVADCRSTECRLMSVDRQSSNRQSAIANRQCELSLSQQLAVLLLLYLVDHVDVLVGDLLHLVETAALVVLRDLVILEQLLQLL